MIERKYWRNEKGVIDRIRHCNVASKIVSIRRTDCDSNSKPSSLCFNENQSYFKYILNNQVI